MPLYRYRDEIQNILNNEQLNWNSKWHQQMRTHPEVLYADYNILVNSKSYFLKNATQICKFDINNLQFFAWVDAGYGHESMNVIPNGLWRPTLPYGKITLLKLTRHIENIEKFCLILIHII